uniref:Uncharacterized protein n=1 Tax=Romanomermis culicivorax TaxID=13658 RepID=A0A915HZH5_ROMCU
MCTTQLKLLTIHKTLKKKKKQKDEWDKSPEVSNDEDPLLQPKKVYDVSKRLHAAIASAMKSHLMHRINDLLGFPVSLIYKLEVVACLNSIKDWLIPSEVDDVWVECMAPNQPLPD